MQYVVKNDGMRGILQWLECLEQTVYVVLPMRN